MNFRPTYIEQETQLHPPPGLSSSWERKLPFRRLRHPEKVWLHDLQIRLHNASSLCRGLRILRRSTSVSLYSKNLYVPYTKIPQMPLSTSFLGCRQGSTPHLDTGTVCRVQAAAPPGRRTMAECLPVFSPPYSFAVSAEVMINV